MDVLNSIALPQSTEHFHLLLFVYNLVMLMAMPYIALLTGALVLAVWADRKNQMGADPYGRHLSRTIVHAVLPSKSVFLYMGILPSLSMVFVYAQLLQGTPALATGFAALGVLLLLCAGIAGFFFQYTFRIEDVLAHIARAKTPSAEVVELETGTKGTHRRSGTVAVWSILGAVFCFSAAQTIAGNPSHWHTVDSLFAAFLSLDVWLSMIFFLSVSAALSGAGILLFHQKHAVSHKADEGYTAHIQRSSIRLSTLALLCAPVVLILTLTRLPDGVLSGWVYALAAVAVLSFFGSLHGLYAFVRLRRVTATEYAFAAMILATTALVTKDQVVLHNATKVRSVVVAQSYDNSKEALKSALGVAVKQFTGEDIYNARCSACHLFDQKKVGPSYKSVLPKYQGKKSQLVSFILNPGKIDPDYPPMPSQGLKPSEADSIATYLLKKAEPKGS